MARTPSCPRLQRDRGMCAGPNCACVQAGVGYLEQSWVSQQVRPLFWPSHSIIISCRSMIWMVLRQYSNFTEILLLVKTSMRTPHIDKKWRV